MKGEAHLDCVYLAGNNYPILSQEAKYNLIAGEGETLGTAGVSQPPAPAITFRGKQRPPLAEAAPACHPQRLEEVCVQCLQVFSSAHGPETLFFLMEKIPTCG